VTTTREDLHFLIHELPASEYERAALVLRALVDAAPPCSPPDDELDDEVVVCRPAKPALYAKAFQGESLLQVLQRVRGTRRALPAASHRAPTDGRGRRSSLLVAAQRHQTGTFVQ
jgi:hypothetical protein